VISTDSAVIAALSTYTNSGYSYPIDTNHTQVLEVTDSAQITNLISATGGVVYTDFLLMPSYSESAPAGIDATYQLAFYVGTNGRPVIWHAYTNGGPMVNQWDELTNAAAISSNEWSRITIAQDYDNDMFQMRINEAEAVTDGKGWTAGGAGSVGPWFYMVQTDGDMEEFNAQESTYLDDLVVTYSDPLAAPAAGIGTLFIVR